MAFQPFMPIEGDYDSLDRGQLRERILRGLTRLTGMHRNLIDKNFLALVDRTLEKNGNRLCCSSVRALVESRIDELPVFKLGGLPISVIRNSREVLAACDFCETVIRIWLDDYIRLAGENFSNDLEKINSLFGTTKLPGLLEAVMENPVLEDGA